MMVLWRHKTPARPGITGGGSGRGRVGAMHRGLVAAMLAALLTTPADAAQRFGGFVVYETAKDVIALDATIGPGTLGDFKRALAERPRARVVLLDSRGGQVEQALELAREIEQRGLSTVVPRGAGCYSACAYVFFAGRERVVGGRLGVHQISGPDLNQLGGTIAFFSHVKGELDRFEVPEGVIKRMLGTRAEHIYVFSDSEIEAMAVNRTAGPDSAAARFAREPPAN